MKNLIRLTDYKAKDVYEIFDIADEIIQGKYKDILNGKTVVLFFPNSSIRTRVTFEKGIRLLGGQAVLFPSDTLDKRENSKDVIGYLNNWADVIVVRHKDIAMLETMSQYSKVPVINALTAINHPCEMLADMYALSKTRKDFTKDKYLFCGLKAIIGKDIVCTDSLPSDVLEKSSDCQVTKAVMEKANKGAVLNPCPPFYRGEEVSGDVIDSEYFVGYEFKKYLLEIQQAVIIYCMIH